MTVPEPRPAEETPETPGPPPAITPAWDALHGWACSQRQDWDEAKVKAAMRAAQARGAVYRDASVILWRLAWDLTAGAGEVLAELSYLNRTAPRTEVPGPSPGVIAALKDGDYELARQLQAAAAGVPDQSRPPAETERQEAGR